MFFNSLNTELCWLCSFFLDWFFSLGSQSSQKWFKKTLFEFFKNIIKPPSLREESIKLVLFVRISVCTSVCSSVCDTFFSRSTGWISLIFCVRTFTICTKKLQSWILKNCICCVGNWVNQTNLDQTQNIWRGQHYLFFCF